MRHCEIAGTGTWLPAATVTFGTHTRYRIAPDESHLDALATAARRALAAAGITAEDVDCLIGASAAGVQPIPYPTLDDGPHLSYAIQWFAFTICVAVGWVLAIRKSAREKAGLPSRWGSGQPPILEDDPVF